MKEQFSKEAYRSPWIQVVELEHKGVLCLSGGEYSGWEEENI